MKFSNSYTHNAVLDQKEARKQDYYVQCNVLQYRNYCLSQKAKKQNMLSMSTGKLAFQCWWKAGFSCGKDITIMNNFQIHILIMQFWIKNEREHRINMLYAIFYSTDITVYHRTKKPNMLTLNTGMHYEQLLQLILHHIHVNIIINLYLTL